VKLADLRRCNKYRVEDVQYFDVWGGWRWIWELDWTLKLNGLSGFTSAFDAPETKRPRRSE
jgi:hypothetical protein